MYVSHFPITILHINVLTIVYVYVWLRVYKYMKINTINNIVRSRALLKLYIRRIKDGMRHIEKIVFLRQYIHIYKNKIVIQLLSVIFISLYSYLPYLWIVCAIYTIHYTLHCLHLLYVKYIYRGNWKQKHIYNIFIYYIDMQ